MEFWRLIFLRRQNVVDLEEVKGEFVKRIICDGIRKKWGEQLVLRIGSLEDENSLCVFFMLVLRLCGITPTSWETNCDFRCAFTSFNCLRGHSWLLTILTLNRAHFVVERKHTGNCLSPAKLNVTVWDE